MCHIYASKGICGFGHGKGAVCLCVWMCSMSICVRMMCNVLTHVRMVDIYICVCLACLHVWGWLVFVCLNIVWYACMHKSEGFVHETCGVSENHLGVSLRCAGYWGSKESSSCFFFYCTCPHPVLPRVGIQRWSQVPCSFMLSGNETLFESRAQSRGSIMRTVSCFGLNKGYQTWW